MIIALDYDDTYTKDPETWNKVIDIFKEAGHTIYCVTMRHDNLHEMNEVYANLNGRVNAIFPTGRKAKKDFMYDVHGIWIDVWIDDTPYFILGDAK